MKTPLPASRRQFLRTAAIATLCTGPLARAASASRPADGRFLYAAVPGI